MQTAFKRIGLVGTGLIGASWAIVFARSGSTVFAYDDRTEVRASLSEGIDYTLAQMQAFGLVDEAAAVSERIITVNTLADAVGDVDYIQESVFESVGAKRAISERIGALMGKQAFVGSSSSGVPASAFTAALTNRDRFLVVHPVNPPHLIPLVELVPAPWTDPSLVRRLRAYLEGIGQRPVVVQREIEGFVLNRLQGALLNEAWAIYEAGVASMDDIDRTVSEGLGLRWSFMGPFETIDLNAPGGIEDYAHRLRGLYHSIALDRRDPLMWSDEIVARAANERNRSLPREDIGRRAQWRDKKLMALAAKRYRMEKAHATENRILGFEAEFKPKEDG